MAVPPAKGPGHEKTIKEKPKQSVPDGLSKPRRYGR